MNSETFVKYLETQSFLYKISYQELKSLIVQYPFCQNLRILLLKKSQMEDNPNFSKNLQMAATYSVDRNLLYKQLIESNKKENSNLELVLEKSEKENLELKDLDVLDLQPKKEILYVNETEEKKAFSPLSDFVFSKDSTEQKEDLELNEIPTVSLVEKLMDEPLPEKVEFIEKIEEEKIEAIEIPIQEEEIVVENISENTIIIEPESAVLEEKLNSENQEMEQEIEQILDQANLYSDDVEDLFTEGNSPIDIPVEIEEKEEIQEVNHETDFVQEPKATQSSSIKEVKEESPKVVELDIAKKEKKKHVHDLEALLNENPAKIPISSEKPIPLEEELEEEIEIQTETISPRSSFNKWLKQFNTKQISIEIEDLAESGKQKVNYKYELIDGQWRQITTKIKKKKKKSAAEQMAAKSVKFNEGIATETLAQLLEKQGHNAKAIKIYDRLSLEIPEKSEFFAAKIEELKKKL